MDLDVKQKYLVEEFVEEFKEDEQTAIRFLMGRKWDKERTRELYKNYREVIKRYGFEWVQMFDVKEELRTQKLYATGGRDKNGAALLVLDGSKHTPGEFSLESTLKMAFWLGGRMTKDPKTQVNGITIIVDLTNAKWANFDSRTQRQVVEFFTNNIPARIKNILVYRPPWWVALAVRIVKPFLKPKMRERLVLVDPGDLTRYVDNDQLPESLGGAFVYDHEEWMRQEQAREEHDGLPLSRQQAQDDGGALALIPTDRRELLQREREKTIKLLDLKIQEHQERLEKYSTPFDLYRLLGDRQTRLQVDLDALPQVEPNRYEHDEHRMNEFIEPPITASLNVEAGDLPKQVEEAMEHRYGRTRRRHRSNEMSEETESTQAGEVGERPVSNRRRRRTEGAVVDDDDEIVVAPKPQPPERIASMPVIQEVETPPITESKPENVEAKEENKEEKGGRRRSRGRRTRLDATVIDLDQARAILAQQQQE